MEFIPAYFKEVIDSPAQTPCPTCNSQKSKLWDTSRSAIDCDTQGLSLLKVVVGVYECMICGKYFRNQPDFMQANALYTNRVVNVAISSVIEDGMPISKVGQRL